MPRPVLFLYIQIYMCVCESKSSCLSSELFVSVVQTSNISFAFEHVNQIKKEWQSINVSFFSLFFLFFCCFSQSKNFIENYLTGKRTNEDWKREFHHRIDCLNDNGSYHADFASFFPPKLLSNNERMLRRDFSMHINHTCQYDSIDRSLSKTINMDKSQRNSIGFLLFDRCLIPMKLSD